MIQLVSKGDYEIIRQWEIWVDHEELDTVSINYPNAPFGSLCVVQDTGKIYSKRGTGNWIEFGTEEQGVTPS